MVQRCGYLKPATNSRTTIKSEGFFESITKTNSRQVADSSMINGTMCFALVIGGGHVPAVR